MRNAAVAQLGTHTGRLPKQHLLQHILDPVIHLHIVARTGQCVEERILTLDIAQRLGFVFQFYNLVANLTAKENVELASEIVHDAQDPTQALIDVGLKERIDNFPAQLSGGEQQRGAVDMYFTEGMTIRKVVAELGYPSEGALAKWVREDPARHGRVQASVYAEMQDERGQTHAGRRASRPRGARRGLHADERAALKCLYLTVRSLDPTGKGQVKWAARRKPALNAFAITFADRWPDDRNN